MSYRAAVVTIGDEILMGEIVDTNAVFLAKGLDDLGIEVCEVVTVADQQEAIDGVMKRLDGVVDLVLLTGGLGPTNDDVTKRVFCDFFDDVLVEDARVLAHVTQLLEDFYKRPISEVNKRQALVPSRGVVLSNRVGTAPGMLMQTDDTVYVCMPGVPYEMKVLFQEQLVPYIRHRFGGTQHVHRSIRTYGIGESLLAEYLADWEEALPAGVTLAYLPSSGRVRLRLSVRGADRVKLQEKLSFLIHQLPATVMEFVVGVEDLELEDQVANLLKKQRQSICFAESCTGGTLARLFTEAPGASAYFKGGVVTYSTESKIAVLGLAPSLLAQQDVVSEAVAMQMAIQSKALFKSDFALSTTGNAGPTKGDSKVAVGTVCVGIATPYGAFAQTFQLGGPRERVVQDAVSNGLRLIYKELIKNK